MEPSPQKSGTPSPSRGDSPLLPLTVMASPSVVLFPHIPKLHNDSETHPKEVHACANRRVDRSYFQIKLYSQVPGGHEFRGTLFNPAQLVPFVLQMLPFSLLTNARILSWCSQCCNLPGLLLPGEQCVMLLLPLPFLKISQRSRT